MRGSFPPLPPPTQLPTQQKFQDERESAETSLFVLHRDKEREKELGYCTDLSIQYHIHTYSQTLFIKCIQVEIKYCS